MTYPVNGARLKPVLSYKRAVIQSTAPNYARIVSEDSLIKAKLKVIISRKFLSDDNGNGEW